MEHFRLVRVRGDIPCSMEAAETGTNHKAGRPPDEPCFYRLTCLTGTMGKLLERVIYNKLVRVIDKQGGLGNRMLTERINYRYHGIYERHVRKCHTQKG